MKRLKILLTGATGQVGWKLFPILQYIGDVIPVVAPGQRFDLGKAVVMDLADPDAICRIIDEIRPDLIVNTAAYTAVDKDEDEAQLAMKINGEAPAIMAEKARKFQFGLIHYSTDYVYTGTGCTPYTEESETTPCNQYGKSKLAGDQAIMAIDCASLILRTSWVYSDIGHNFPKTILKLGREREELRIIDDQVGAPTSASTIANITGMILANRLGGHLDLTSRLYERRGVYHVVNAGETSWHGFAQKTFVLARQLGYTGILREVVPILTEEYLTAAVRPKNSRLSCKKLENIFGLRPSSWANALACSLPGVLKNL